MRNLYERVSVKSFRKESLSGVSVRVSLSGVSVRESQ